VLVVDIGLVVLGLALLIAGGEALVRGASTFAARVGISPLVIGLIVVSSATSAPEFAVTIGAVIEGEPGLAVGNVIGSNIANVLLILGFSAMLSPLAINRQVVRFDIPVMVGLTVLFLGLTLDGEISLIDGILLLLGLVLHATASVVIGRRDAAILGEQDAQEALNTKPVPLWLATLLLVGGVALLVGGAQVLVTGAVNIAIDLGVSSLVVGLTVVAIGTSLPELATSLVAIRRGERDMAVGNIVGSNIVNIGFVLGVPAIVFREGIAIPGAAVALDIPLMLAASVALLPIAFTGFIVARWEGTLFVALYLSYLAYVVLAATEHDAVTGFSVVMLWFVLPLIAVTVIALTAYEIRIHRKKPPATPHD